MELQRARSLLSKHVLLVFLLIALLLRLAATRFPNLAHPDEIFQTEEPAHRLAYGYGVVTWEWREGIRSWVFPAFLAGVMRTTDWMGANSAGYLRGVVLILSLISLITVWFAFMWAKRTSGMAAAIIASGCCAVWYQLIDFGGRALTEVVATHLLLPGLYLGVYGEGLPERKRLFLAGIFCGAALSLRIQLTPAIAFAVLYFCRSNWRKKVVPVAVGLMLPILAFGIVDMLTWSYPFQSFIRYFWVNVVEGRSIAYGVEPWYWYVVVLLEAMGPMLIFAILGVRQSPFLGWVALIILVSHSALSHKEVRFLYPLVPIIITLAALGIAELASTFSIHGNSVASSRATVAGGMAVCALASLLLAPRFPYWARNSGAIVAFDRLSRDSDLCGLGIYAVPWFDTGGYTHLHRNVPIIPVLDTTGLAKSAPAFNALVAPIGISDVATSFNLVGCWNGICLHRRAGACSAPQPENELNDFLRRTGN